jgi:hypothetical protein
MAGPGNPFARYNGVSPLWFVDASSARAIHVTSRASCLYALKVMAPLPFFDPAGLTS